MIKKEGDYIVRSWKHENLVTLYAVYEKTEGDVRHGSQTCLDGIGMVGEYCTRVSEDRKILVHNTYKLIERAFPETIGSPRSMGRVMLLQRNIPQNVEFEMV